MLTIHAWTKVLPTRVTLLTTALLRIAHSCERGCNLDYVNSVFSALAVVSNFGHAFLDLSYQSGGRKKTISGILDSQSPKNRSPRKKKDEKSHTLKGHKCN